MKPSRLDAIAAATALSLAVATGTFSLLRDAGPSPQAATSSAPTYVARHETKDERAELVLAVRREQAQARRQLERAIDEADRTLAEPSPSVKADVARTRRANLEADLHAIDASTDTEWDGVKARIEQTLGSG